MMIGGKQCNNSLHMTVNALDSVVCLEAASEISFRFSLQPK